VFYFHAIYPTAVLCVPLVFITVVFLPKGKKPTAVFLYRRYLPYCCVFSAACILDVSNLTNDCIFINH